MAFTLATGARFPLAPGTVPSCNQYRNHFTKAVPAIANQEVIDIKASPIYQPQNDCCWIAQKHGSTLENLLQWNPSLNSEDCELQPGYGYCVSKTKGSESRIAARHGTCLPNDALKYTEIMAGTDPNCDCFAMVISEERRDDDRLTCSRLVETANLPIENIIKYNSWISKADCDGSLYAGLGAHSSRAVCIGTSSLPTKTDVVLSSTSTKPPICTFDPDKGEYVCPDPPICTFDPEKREQVCPEAVVAGGAHAKRLEESAELR